MQMTKAVIPAMKEALEFMPASNAMPREMLPLVDRPAIHYIIEEASRAGIEIAIMILGERQRIVPEYFAFSQELDKYLEGAGKVRFREMLKEITDMIRIAFIRSRGTSDLKDALMEAEGLIGGENFGVLMPEEIYTGEVSALQRLAEIREKTGGAVVAVSPFDEKQRPAYGCLAVENAGDGIYRVRDVSDKEKAGENEKTLKGRLVFDSSLFESLKETITDREWGLSDVVRAALAAGTVYALEFEDDFVRFDDRMEYLSATLETALRSPEIGETLRSYIHSLKLH